jgi:hypothetical protein
MDEQTIKRVEEACGAPIAEVMEHSADLDDVDDVFGPPISVYTREQAFEDGQLVDVSQADVTRDAGFKVPVALTSGAWAWVNPEPMPSCQDHNGRLWDVYTMFRYARRTTRGATDRIAFSVLFQGGPGLRGRQKRRVDLVAVCGPADDGSPCITIMLPEED